jgi:hypothetical protein
MATAARKQKLALVHPAISKRNNLIFFIARVLFPAAPLTRVALCFRYPQYYFIYCQLFHKFAIQIK